MMADEVRVLGVYKVDSSSEVHLIEVEVDSLPAEVDVGLFTQEDPTLPRASWQVAYDERYLNQDGTEAGCSPSDAPGGAPTRFVFFLHFIDFNRPIRTPGGEVMLPPPEPTPDRLRQIEYEEVD
jgi:hypothetical protein